MMSSREVKEYLSHHHLPQLLESLLTGLLYHHPEDPISFLQSCLITARQLGGPGAITWDTFIHSERNQLIPTPPRTTSVLTSQSLPPIKPQTPQTPAPIPPRTPPITTKKTHIPSTNTPIPKIPPLIPPIAPFISPKITPIPPITPSLPLIKPPIPQTTSNISSKTTSIPPKTSPVTPPKTPQIPQKSPSAAPIIILMPPTSTQLPLIHSGPKIPSIKPKICTEHKVIIQDPPGPETSPPDTEKEEPGDPNKFCTEASPPSLPPLPICSQLSIDSDSDLTESSGLLQEVSILTPVRPRPLTIFIIGGPGSGKGTQAARLAHFFGLRVISLDELLRRQLLSHASPSRKWRFISEMMGHGELGTQEETISELKRQLIDEQKVRGVIVDGFPRDVHQALSFQEQIGSPDLVMLLLCSNETLCHRLQQRATQLGLLGDNSHALRRRLGTFQRDIISISRYYRQLRLLTQVDADRDEEMVFADLSSVIREKLPPKDSGPTDAPQCSSAIRSFKQHELYHESISDQCRL